MVEETEALVEDAALVNVLVHHQRIGTGIRRLHQEMQDAMNPGECAEEQVDSTRNGCGKVEQQMREHHHICVKPDDRLGDADVVPQDILIERSLPVNTIVVRTLKDRRLKIGIGRVIQPVEI